MNEKKLLWVALFMCSIVPNLFGQSFYDQGTIQTINVHMSQNNWDQLLDNAYSTTGDYIMADSVTINGEVFDSVGVKYKGNSSYSSNQTKNPWHIELDTYKDHDYEGYKDIKLANVYNDPSFLRDVLGYQIVRQYMDAPLANYANLSVNGTLIGLYSNTEAISKTFVKDRFGHKTNAFFSCSPPEGAGPTTSDYPNLVYLGTDSADYYDAYEMKSDYGWKELIEMCDTLKDHTTLIESNLDVDRAIWMLAFDNAIVNLDSYIGAFSQNYYLYKDNFGRFLPIVWDLNESFGTFSSTGTINLNNTTSKQQMSHLLHSTDADWPLISKLLSVPTYKKMYLAHIKTILEENFTANGPYYTMAQSIRSTIDAAVQADPNKFYTYAQFNSNWTTDITSGGGGGPGGGGGGPGGASVPGITNLMDARYSYLMSQSDFTATQPSISNVLVVGTPTIGSTVTITATVTDELNVYLRYRSQTMAPFEKVEMFDDGNHNDGAANDDVFGAEITLTSSLTEYYIYAENSNIGKFSPVRAEHEFYSLLASGGLTPGDIVINEFMASNDTTIADQDGDYDDWVEVYNNGTSAIDISGYGLTDDISDLGLYVFPSGTVLQPDDYIVVWADKEVGQTGYHADFKLSSGGEMIILTDAGLSIIDSVTYGAQNTDETYGRYPNGTGSFQTMIPTFGAENNIGSVVTSDIVINEFMASNDTTMADQDGDYDDWVEVYNNSTSAIDISGYGLSDDVSDLSLYVFPSGTVLQPDDYIVVWADKEVGQTGYHADFKLSSGGETIFLSDAGLDIIDSVSYGTLNTDETYGRYPNGTGPFQTLEPTFGAENTIATFVTGDIVINEFMASNDTTMADQDGDYDDWVEVYNNSTSAIDISGYGLSDDVSDLSLYVFPSGTVLQPDDYIVVWADKEVGQTGYHADFKLSSTGETIFLTNASLNIIDSVSYGTLDTDETYGRYPNGTGPFQTLIPTFGAENYKGVVVTGEIVINEFMASNDSSVVDQDGGYDDWVELYNTTSSAIDISGYGLTDDIGELDLYLFPSGTVLQANEYIVVWADKEVGQTGYHADFKLSSTGETIILSNADLDIIDSLTYGEQDADVTFGRYPNGTGPFQTLSPTIGAENTIDDDTTSIVEIDRTTDLVLYPNPSRDYFIVEVAGDNFENSQIVVYNISGQQVYAAALQSKVTVSTQSFENGMYFVKVGNSVRKLIVNK